MIFKKLALTMCLLCTFMVFAQEQEFNFGNLNIFLIPRILADGSITDFGFGFTYSERWSGDLDLRYTAIAKNEELQDVSDSLNAVKENNFKIFLMPGNFRILNTSNSSFYLGGGIYYEYEKLTEKGFFNMPALENLGKERVNSYSNNFSMHIIGPLLATGFDTKAKFLKVALNSGIVPVFFLASSQKMSMIPLLDTNYADYSQKTAGSPYFFVDFDIIVFKYVNIFCLYDFALLKYRNIDFNENLDWYTPERKVRTQSVKIEAAALIPIGDSMSARIGYGHTFEMMKLDTVASNNNKPYMIVAIKKATN